MQDGRKQRIQFVTKNGVVHNQQGQDKQQALCCFTSWNKEKNGPQTYFYMSLQNMLAILRIITNIQILIKRETDQEQCLTLDDYIKISVSKFRGKKYIGFISTGKKPNRMNIDLEKFKQLVQNMVDIESFIDSIYVKQQKSEETKPTSDGNVSLYKWGYFNVETGELVEKKGKSGTLIQTDVM